MSQLRGGRKQFMQQQQAFESQKKAQEMARLKQEFLIKDGKITQNNRLCVVKTAALPNPCPGPVSVPVSVRVPVPAPVTAPAPDPDLPARKRRRCIIEPFAPPKPSRLMLHERYSPERAEDCAVFPKSSLATISEWFQNRLVLKEDDTPRCLLVLGPSGSGKTALVRALCKQHGVNLNRPSNVDSMAKLFASVEQTSFAKSTIGAKRKDVWLYTGVDGYVLFEPKAKASGLEMNAGGASQASRASGASRAVSEVSAMSKASGTSGASGASGAAGSPPSPPSLKRGRFGDDDDDGDGDGDGDNGDGDGNGNGNGKRGGWKASFSGDNARSKSGVPSAVLNLLRLISRPRKIPKTGAKRELSAYTNMAPVIFTAHDCPTPAMQTIKAHPAVKVVNLRNIPEAEILRVLRDTVRRDGEAAKLRTSVKLQRVMEEGVSALVTVEKMATADARTALVQGIAEKFATARRYLSKISAEIASVDAVAHSNTLPSQEEVGVYSRLLDAKEAVLRRVVEEEEKEQTDVCSAARCQRHYRPLKKVVKQTQLEEIANEADGDIRKALIALEAAMFFPTPISAGDKTMDVFSAAKTLLDVVISPEKETHTPDDLYRMAANLPNTLLFVYNNMYETLMTQTPTAGCVESMAVVADAWSSCIDTYEKVSWRYGQTDGIGAKCALISGIQQMAMSKRPAWGKVFPSSHPLKSGPRFKAREAAAKMQALRMDGNKCPPKLALMGMTEYNERMTVLRAIWESVTTVRPGSISVIQPTEEQAVEAEKMFDLDIATSMVCPFYYTTGVTASTTLEYDQAMISAMEKCGVSFSNRPPTLMKDGVLIKL